MRAFFFFIILVLGFSFSAQSAVAAVVKIDSDFSVLQVGDVFVVEVLIDTEKQVLNAAGATISYPSDLFEFVSSNDGDSIVSLWIQNPEQSGEGSISFSGITPGGFNQEEASLLSLTFKARAIGQGKIETLNAELLQNDGLGTPAPLTLENLHISIQEGETNLTVGVLDEEPPESFAVEIINDKDIFEGSHVLIFATKDKGSGVAYFEVKEGIFSRYQRAESPHKLLDQELDQKIYVRAVDGEGNERVEVVYPQNWKPLYTHAWFLIAILLVCVLTLFISWRIALRLRKR